MHTVKDILPYRVLVVEDNEEISDYVKKELVSSYRITQMKNGEEALDFILEEKLSLVVGDMAPVKGGVSLCKKIKANKDTEHIPVVLLTEEYKDENLAEGLSAGADAVVKLFSPEILKMTAANLLNNRERWKGKLQQQTEEKTDETALKSRDELLLDKVSEIINENIDNTELNVNMLSDAVGMSRVHLYRRLKELTAQSASDFIRSTRIKQANGLLRNKRYSISEVAYQVGFSTPSHFSKCFKDFYGMPPKEYVEKNCNPHDTFCNA